MRGDRGEEVTCVNGYVQPPREAMGGAKAFGDPLGLVLRTDTWCVLYVLRRVGLQLNVSVSNRHRKTFGPWVVLVRTMFNFESCPEFHLCSYDIFCGLSLPQYIWVNRAEGKQKAVQGFG